MNYCVICGTKFKPSKQYPERKTCSKECYKIHMKNLVPETFLENSFNKGNVPFNKGVPQSEWLSKDAQDRCSKTHIQHQKNCISKYAAEEGRYLPHNTYGKGTVVARSHTHNKGKFKGKTEIEYYINIDWHGNRKPNNLYRRYLWEVYHQQDIPKGMVIYSKEKDYRKWNKDNLILISRGELAKINRWGRNEK